MGNPGAAGRAGEPGNRVGGAGRGSGAEPGDARPSFNPPIPVRGRVTELALDSCPAMERHLPGRPYGELKLLERPSLFIVNLQSPANRCAPRWGSCPRRLPAGASGPAIHSPFRRALLGALCWASLRGRHTGVVGLGSLRGHSSTRGRSGAVGAQNGGWEQ